jgi:hypothetical protein
MGLERREDKLKERPIVLRKRRERIKSEANWSLFYYKFTQDHALPNLIWNHKVSAASRGCMGKVGYVLVQAPCQEGIFLSRDLCVMYS